MHAALKTRQTLYRRASAEIHTEIMALQAELLKHAACDQPGYTPNYSHIGDLNEVLRLVRGARTFIDGTAE